jgi:chemotaxis protein methyltransferase CheR
MTVNLPEFKLLIKERCGLLFEGESENKLARLLDARIAGLSVKSAEYYRRLVNDEAEFQALVNQLTINETYFFREYEQIRLLVDRIAPRFLACHAGRTPVRILSAGCSSGEEPYSLVMALMDKYGDSVSRLFSFAGGDIDSTVLNKARLGLYSEFSFRGVPDDLRNRYFKKDSGGYLLNEQVKSQVSFHELNLLANTFPSTLLDFDIIFFRNVSIYFDAQTRLIIQHKLSSLMKENGVLVIGTAETLANDLGVMPLMEEDGLFYFVKGNPPLDKTDVSARMDQDMSPVAPVFCPLPVMPTVPPLPLIPSNPKANIEYARKLTRDMRYDLALPVLDAVLSIEPDHVEAMLLKAHVLINRKDMASAKKLAQSVLQANQWSVDAFFLLGQIAKWCQQSDEAIRWFKQATYSRQECWPAHYYLADLYRKSGELNLAARAYRVVIQLLSSGEPDTGIKYLPHGLLTGEIRFLCEHQLAKLSDMKSSAS